MLKYMPSLLLTTTLFASSSMNYIVSNKHAFVLPQNNIGIKASYLKSNDTLDIFHLKEKQFKNLGSIGNMGGYSLELRYGISSKDSIFISTQRWNIDYGDSILKNNKYNIFNRYEVINAPRGFFNFLSFDIGFERNSADPIIVSNEKSLNTLIKKIKPNSDINLNDIKIANKNGEKVSPYIAIDNLGSNSYYGRILIGKEISETSFLDLYLGYKYNQITTGITFYPDTTFTQNLLKNYTIPNLDRNEQDLQFGISYFLQINRFVGEINYEFNKLFRDSDVSYLDYSHIIDASISIKVAENTLIYIGGKLMFQQFNSDIPYLYNRYTKTQFDHKYGFAKFGIIYKF